MNYFKGNLNYTVFIAIILFVFSVFSKSLSKVCYESWISEKLLEGIHLFQVFIECAGKTLRSSVIQKYKSNPNFTTLVDAIELVRSRPLTQINYFSTGGEP